MRARASFIALCFVVCSTLFSLTGAAYASTPTAAVWVGSPVDGHWPNTADCYTAPVDVNCALPKYHHAPYWSYYPAPTGAQQGDWAMDMYPDGSNHGAGTKVILYAAPNQVGRHIYAHVQTVASACYYSYEHAGSHVTILLSDDNGPIGTVTFAHIEPTVYQGQDIPRWGQEIGTVGDYTNSQHGGCWGGIHLHVEMSNYHRYACYTSAYYPTDRDDKRSPSHLAQTNFIGFIGGAYASQKHAACP